jgi:O-antigen/teichoic acid export membrane protein
MSNYLKLISVFIGNMSLAVSSFIIAAILIANSDIKDYGEFVLYQASIVSWVILSKPPIWQAIVKFSHEIKLTEVLRITFSIEIVSYVLLSLLSLIIAIFFFTDQFIDNYIIIFICIFFGYFINSGVVLGVFRSESKFYVLSLIQFITSMMKLICCFFYHTDILILFTVFVLIDGFVWLFVYIYIYIKKVKYEILPKEVDANYSKKIFSFSLWSWGNSISDLPVTQFDRVIIAYLMGLEVVGVYNIMKRVSQLLGQVADPISQIAFPAFSRMLYSGERDKIYKIVIKISFLMIVVTLITLLITNVFYDFVNIKVFSNKLFLYKNELLMFMSIQGISLVFVWIHPLFLSVGRMKEGFFIVTLSSFIYVSILVLFKDMELFGILLATIIQYVVLISLKFYYIYFKSYEVN